MGIVNVTPDSFSDGGDWILAGAAAARGRQLVAEGADIVDIGGESTRPGAQRAGVATELARVIPAIEELAAAGVPVSVDTMSAEVARRAVEAGALIVNDVSGGLADETMLATVAGLGVHYVAMHWRGFSDVMTDLATYTDVVAEVRDELAARRDAALAAGIPRERLILDPGLGFAKTAEHNWTLLAHLDVLAGLGQPLLIGASRKRFLGALLADEDGPRPPKDRDDATAAVTALVARQRVWGVRTHTARAHADAIAVAERLRAEEASGGVG